MWLPVFKVPHVSTGVRDGSESHPYLMNGGR